MTMQGEPFGRYRLLRRIAFGGMAEIFLAALHRDEGFEKRVVVKRILPQFGADPAFVQMFIDEAVVAARISHPNVVQVYDFGNVDGMYFIAMEHVDGVDLRRVLGADGPRLTAAEVAAIGEGVARALAHAHNLADDDGAPLNIVHRDVSPHNIMISRAGEAKLMDFGIAKAEARVSKTATGTIKGKVAYMAPEQGAGRSVDKRTDQFALGLVLWECLTGERMFAGDSDLEVLQQVVRCDVRDLSGTGAPEPLAAVIMRCLRADPDARYPDLTEAADALAAFRYSLGAAGAVQLGELAARVAQPQSGGRRTQALPEDAAQPGTRPLTEPSAPASSGWEDTVLPTASTAAQQPAAPSAQAAASPAAAPTPAAPEQPSARRWWWGAAAGLVAAVVALVVWQRSAPRADAAIAQLAVSSVPAGARVLLEGRDTGLETPATLPGQVRGRTVHLEVLLDGYEPWQTDVTPSTAVERVSATLLRAEELPARSPPPEAVPQSDVGREAAAAEPAAPTAAPEPAPAPKAAVAAESRKKQRRAKKETGRLSLRSTGAWVDVFLRGRKLGTTPLSSVEVPAGKHRLRLVNEAAGIDQIIDVRVQPNAELRRTVTPK